MSNPIGATHAIQAMIWERQPIIPREDKFYDLVFCDGATGHVEKKDYNLPGIEAKKEIENWSGPKHGLKVFVYEK